MERMAGDFRMEREKIANKERINAGQQQRRSDAAEQALRLELPLVEAAFAKVSKESDEWKDRFEAMRAALRAREPPSPNPWTRCYRRGAWEYYSPSLETF